MIEIKSISYTFGDQIVFQNASLRLPKHGLVALTGANGVGKTTLLRILGRVYHSKLTFPHSRWATYLDTEFLTLDMLTVDELLNLLGNQGKTIDREALSRNALIDEKIRNTRVAGLSLGQRQRLVISVATALTTPTVVLLDEPFNGLDQLALVE